jgi:hypothetical protein
MMIGSTSGCALYLGKLTSAPDMTPDSYCSNGHLLDVVNVCSSDVQRRIRRKSVAILGADRMQSLEHTYTYSLVLNACKVILANNMSWN